MLSALAPLAAILLLGTPVAAEGPSASTPLWVSPATPPRIAELRVEGADAGSVLALLSLQVGAPLDPRDVRDAVRELHASARFSHVAVYAEPLPDGRVRVVFELTKVQKLVSVSFPGRESLAESLLHQAANLQVNAEYLPEAVPGAVEGIRAAYQRLGYRHVGIVPEARAAPGGVLLEFHIDEGPQLRVREVRFEPLPGAKAGLSPDQLSAAFRLSPGDAVAAAALEEGARSLRERYRREGHLRARVDPPVVEELDPGSARVIVPIDGGALVRFVLRGNRTFSDSTLEAQLSIGDEALDAQAASDLAGRLRRFYVTAGFLRARVAERELALADGSVQVVFAIDEDRPVRVEEIRFPGAERIPAAEHRSRLSTLLHDGLRRDPANRGDGEDAARIGLEGRPRRAPPPHYVVDPETVFDPVVYARAIKQLEDLYRSEGYLSVHAGPPKLEPIGGDPHRLRVSVPVREGERTLVSRIVVEGGVEVPVAELDRAVALHVGQPFSYLAVEEGRAALTQLFTKRGHLYARVEDEETFGDLPEGAATNTVSVRYRIQPGPEVHIGYVEVVGQRRTQEGLVRDLIGLRPGDVLTPDAIDRGQQALLRTGLFFSATLTPRNPEVAEPEKTLQVQLRERPTRDFQASVGFSLADGPRTSAQYTQGNLLGRNLTFSVVAKADFPFLRFPSHVECPTPTQCHTVIDFPDDPLERVLDVGLSVPRLWPLTTLVGGSIDLIHERDVRPSYRLTKYSVQLGLFLTQRRPLSVALAYEVGSQNTALNTRSIEEILTGVDQRAFRLPDGRMLFGSLRPSATLDLRDDPARPRAGIFLQGSGDFLRSFEFAKSQSALDARQVHVNLLKLQGLAAGYVPLPFSSSVVLSARGGRVFQLDERSATPGDRRFYLGGATTLRGFHEDAVQPQDLVRTLHDVVRECEKTLTDISCSQEAKILQLGGTSDGGDEFIAMSAELRVPLATSVELGLFYDAGNLWVRPQQAFFRSLVLRDAAGFGLRWVTPIGRIAADLGFNLNPDPLFGEPRVGPYFSIEVL